ncbi:hypothetical protein A374_09239 [Fictibacillus macauensis ZFHKF-1]|uniref:Uncharacterized protein n=1 Tax=Fictibacillus macauensis ZFHKF-1 TaxID=1196324 RepID=I8AKD1_9BACL|nr:hypothetical protein [Fictibacillus macauensis]EIT86009.1 hypothetical protein A374_09239 [Fictibacillus macauensis ZFHKF-1]
MRYALFAIIEEFLRYFFSFLSAFTRLFLHFLYFSSLTYVIGGKLSGLRANQELLRANGPGLRANQGLLRANGPGLRANQGLLRANGPGLRANQGLLRANGLSALVYFLMHLMAAYIRKTI